MLQVSFFNSNSQWNITEHIKFNNIKWFYLLVKFFSNLFSKYTSTTSFELFKDNSYMILYFDLYF
jgi:hypothetical protein